MQFLLRSPNLEPKQSATATFGGLLQALDFSCKWQWGVLEWGWARIQRCCGCRSPHTSDWPPCTGLSIGSDRAPRPAACSFGICDSYFSSVLPEFVEREKYYIQRAGQAHRMIDPRLEKEMQSVSLVMGTLTVACRQVHGVRWCPPGHV